MEACRQACSSDPGCGTEFLAEGEAVHWRHLCKSVILRSISLTGFTPESTELIFSLMYRYLPYPIPMRPSLTCLTSIDSGREASPSNEINFTPADFLQPALQDRKFFGFCLLTVTVGGFSLLTEGSSNYVYVLKSISVLHVTIESGMAVLVVALLALFMLNVNFSFNKQSK